MRLIDVSVPLDPRLPVYPGNLPFSLEPIKRIAKGGSSNVSAIHMSAHAGTHVDAPRHFFDDGPGTDALPLDMLMGSTHVLDLSGVAASSGVGAVELKDVLPDAAIRVLIKTTNSRLWESPAFQPDYVGVTEDGARFLVERGVRVLGVDYLSVEVFRKPGAPAHHVLLAAGIAIIEGLNLQQVTAGVYDMVCLPLRLADADGAPARVVLRAG